MTIKMLSKDAAEKIAAGEVIENPASVVKELVENALDAGAAKIEIAIESGGRDLITVADDGEGIRPDEVALAFKRFATSKLSAIEDLDCLASLGFRGEALPSIAAVSKLEMTTRPANAVGATKISLEGGEEKEFTEAGAPCGTTVKVKELFFNTPGRKKFLKAPAVEASRVSALISAMALAHPDRSFSLQSGGRTLLKTSGDGKLLHVIGAVYGQDTAAAMVELKRSADEEGTVPEGCISVPRFNRSSRKWITIVVNGRIVNNSQISSALIRAYGNQLPINRFPLAVLKLQIKPELIDVNVHPAKTEIRFIDSEAVKKVVYKTVKLSLQNLYDLPQWPTSHSTTPSVKSPDNYSQYHLYLPKSCLYGEHLDSGSLNLNEADQQPEKLFMLEGSTPLPELPGESRESFAGDDLYYTLIGQYLNSYILVQRGEKLLLIDQHAAHERLIYNRIKASLGSESKVKTIQLTIPYMLDIPVLWREQLPLVLPFLISCGIDLEQIDPDSYVVRAVPLIGNELLKDYEISDLLEKLITGDGGENTVFQHDALLKTVACHRSVKAKQFLTRTEMEQLLRDWFETESAGYCPHGRPTVISFEREQLEKSFLRRGI